MKALSLLAMLVLGTAALTPGSSAEVPLLTDIPYCLTPECTSVTDAVSCQTVDRYDNGGTLHTTVGSDCHVRIDHKPYDCVWNCGWRTVVDTPYLTIRQYGQNGPESSAASAAALPIPPPCYSMATSTCCGGPGFAPCPPPCDECQPAGPCPERSVATSQVLAYLGPHAGVAVHADCTADAWEAGIVCPSLAPQEGAIARSVGPVEVYAETCVPNLDCTCPPLMAPFAADLDLPDLPGPPTFPVCVTQPCAYVVCDHAQDDVLGALRYEFGSDCTVDVRDDVMCEASHYETVGAGPLTVGLEQCDPGNPAATSSAALAPPIVCVMAPCGPQCLVPCFPQLVPSDCELRQATPEAVRAQVWGTSPYDCTVDVEPAYMCVGGWGFDRHVTAAFVDVTVRVCTGGPFPPPVVQAILDALALE